MQHDANLDMGSARFHQLYQQILQLIDLMRFALVFIHASNIIGKLVAKLIMRVIWRAAPAADLTFPPAMQAFTYGWGRYEDKNSQQLQLPRFDLKGLELQTSSCMGVPGHPHLAWRWRHSQTPIFICSLPTLENSPCSGDSGGTAPA